MNSDFGLGAGYLYVDLTLQNQHSSQENYFFILC